MQMMFSQQSKKRLIALYSNEKDYDAACRLTGGYHSKSIPRIYFGGNRFYRFPFPGESSDELQQCFF